MSQSNESHTRFKFLWIDITFSKEPDWVKILIIVLALAAFAAILILLQQYAPPALAVERLTKIKVGEIISSLKLRSP